MQKFSHLLFWLSLLLAPNLLFANPIYTALFSNQALAGYDSVAYFTQAKAVKGNPKYKTKYKKAIWLFTSAKNLAAFKTHPTRYAPQYGGYCAWALGAQKGLAKGDPRYWTIYQGKLYLNYNQTIQNKWRKDKVKFINTADLAWPKLAK